MHTDSAKVIKFPQPDRQLGTATVSELTNGLPSQCQLLHNNKSLNVISVVDIPHQWQDNETVFVIHNNNRAVVIGCKSMPDNCYNLNFRFNENNINLEFGYDKTGKKLNDYSFLCGNTTIKINDTGGFYLDMETLDNNGLWCLSIIGLQLYVI